MHLNKKSSYVYYTKWLIEYFSPPSTLNVYTFDTWDHRTAPHLCVLHYPASVRIFYQHTISCDIPQIQGAIIRKTKQRHNNFISVLPCSIYGANKWDYYHWMSIKRNWILKISEYFFLSIHSSFFFSSSYYASNKTSDSTCMCTQHWSIRMLPPKEYPRIISIYTMYSGSSPNRIWILCT